MPRQDVLGQWYDAETGLYFDAEARAPVYIQVPQYWGKRAVISETRNGMIRVYVENSRLSTLGERTITKAQFEGRPKDEKALAAWACEIIGIKLED